MWWLRTLETANQWTLLPAYLVRPMQLDYNAQIMLIVHSMSLWIELQSLNAFWIRSPTEEKKEKSVTNRIICMREAKLGSFRPPRSNIDGYYAPEELRQSKRITGAAFHPVYKKKTKNKNTHSFGQSHCCHSKLFIILCFFFLLLLTKHNRIIVNEETK